jgi:hypothetical protein
MPIFVRDVKITSYYENHPEELAPSRQVAYQQTNELHAKNVPASRKPVSPFIKT